MSRDIFGENTSSGTPAYLPDYNNGSFRTIDSANMSNKHGPYSFTQNVTPQTSGWIMVQAAFNLVSTAGQQAQATLMQDPDGAAFQLDHFVVSSGDSTTFLSGLVSPGKVYGLSIDIWDSTCQASLLSIFEVPSL